LNKMRTNSNSLDKTRGRSRSMKSAGVFCSDTVGENENKAKSSPSPLSTKNGGEEGGRGDKNS